MATGASPSIIDLQSLSARMLSAAQFTDQDKFALIRAALESRDDEQLTKLLATGTPSQFMSFYRTDLRAFA